MRFRKVFGMGLSKTATTSLAKALRQLDISCAHYPVDRTTLRQLDAGDFRLDLLETVDAVTDIVLVPFYAQLDRLYPDSGFILTLRQIDDWLESVRLHWATRGGNIAADIRQQVRHRVYGCHDFNAPHYRFVFDRHRRDLETYFAERRDRLLIMNICDGEGWDVLCPFLGVPTPSIPFPWVNGRTDERQGDSKEE